MIRFFAELRPTTKSNHQRILSAGRPCPRCRKKPKRWIAQSKAAEEAQATLAALALPHRPPEGPLTDELIRRYEAAE